MTGPEEQTHFERTAAAITELDLVQGTYQRVDLIQEEGIELGQRVEEGLSAAIDNIAAAEEEVGSTKNAGRNAYEAVGAAILSLKTAIEAVDGLCNSVDRTRDFVVDAHENIRTRREDHEKLVIINVSVKNVAQDGKAFTDAAYGQLAPAEMTSPEPPHLVQEMTAKTHALKEKADSYAEVGQAVGQMVTEEGTRDLGSIGHHLREVMLSRFDTYSDPELTTRLVGELENALTILEKSKEGIWAVRQQMTNHSRTLPDLRRGLDDLQDNVQDTIKTLVTNQDVPRELSNLAAAAKTDGQEYLNS